MFRHTLCAAAAFTALAFAPGVQANLILNPGFESGDFTEWETSGDTLVGVCPGPVLDCAPEGGMWLAVINNSTGFGNGSVRQTVSLPGAGDYVFGAYVALGTDEAGANFDQAQISVTIQLPGGESETIGLDPNALNGQFTIPGNSGFNFTPWLLLTGLLSYEGELADVLYNINVQDFPNTGGLVLAFDNAFVDAVAVPEPETLGLLGAALLAFALRAFGRRRLA